MLASRNTKTSVVVQWDRPKHEEDLLGYYVDCCVAGSNVWEPCNHKPIGYNRCGAPDPLHGKDPQPAGSHAALRVARTSADATVRLLHGCLFSFPLMRGQDSKADERVEDMELE